MGARAREGVCVREGVWCCGFRNGHGAAVLGDLFVGHPPVVYAVGLGHVPAGQCGGAVAGRNPGAGSCGSGFQAVSSL